MLASGDSYVGSFSKTLFPALRLGFLIVPADLSEPLVAARRAADQHPPVLDQAVLADFIGEGHFARHLRRMRTAYGERLAALADAAGRYCGDALRLRRCGPVCTPWPTFTAPTLCACRRRPLREGSRRSRWRRTPRGRDEHPTA